MLPTRTTNTVSISCCHAERFLNYTNDHRHAAAIYLYFPTLREPLNVSYLPATQNQVTKWDRSKNSSSSVRAPNASQLFTCSLQIMQ